MLIPVMIAASFIVFTLMELAPGSIIDGMIQDGMTQEDIAALRAKYNLDRSMLYRYGLYMLNLVRGDLGVSDITGFSVWRVYTARLPNTLLLCISGLIIGAVVAVPVGIFASRRAGRLPDNITSGITVILMSMPNFWLGLMLMLLFSLRLGWLPAGGMDAGWRSLILPAFCVAAGIMANCARQTRSSMLEVLNADFLRTARAKGVSEKDVIRRHALGNAWIPIITQLGTSLGAQLAGSVVIESVFTWPGVGRATVEAVIARDVTTATGFIIMTSILYVVLQLIVDLLYATVDPRIKSQYVGVVRKRGSEPTEPAAFQLAAAGDVSPGFEPEEFVQPGVDFPVPEPLFMQADDSVPDVSETSAPLYTAQVLTGSEPVLATQPAETADVSDNAGTAEMDKAAGLVSKKYKKKSRFGELLHHISKNKGAVAGIVILVVMIALALYSLTMSWESITNPNMRNTLSPPTWQNLFGTDRMGRDIFLRVIYGSRYSLVIGFGAVSVSAILGITLGSLAGFFGKATENVIMRLSDTLSSIPGLLLGMVIMVVLGMGLRNIVIAVGIGSMSAYIRITRASILSVRTKEFVEAARATGLSNLHILFKHVLPNGLSPIIVQMSVGLGFTIVVASSLSFLGFGVQIPTPEWGALISSGRDLARTAPWVMAFPGVFIVLTVLGFNLVGDGLRDALDPKLKKR